MYVHGYVMMMGCVVGRVRASCGARGEGGGGIFSEGANLAEGSARNPASGFAEMPEGKPGHSMPRCQIQWYHGERRGVEGG